MVHWLTFITIYKDALAAEMWRMTLNYTADFHCLQVKDATSTVHIKGDFPVASWFNIIHYVLLYDLNKNI